ncbi:DUF2509 family protein [Edwardsiella hoshinae]|nr:DUF2509 family protein [Edwardsiella hoshinae]
MTRQRGVVVLATLLAALMLALGWVLAQQAQTRDLWRRHFAWQRHWQAEAQAELWLARAQRLPWRATDHWRCRSLDARWRACLRATGRQWALLCICGWPEHLDYPLVRIRYLWSEDHEHTRRYRAASAGWLDYLPGDEACPPTGERAVGGDGGVAVDEYRPVGTGAGSTRPVTEPAATGAAPGGLALRPPGAGADGVAPALVALAVRLAAHA